MTSTYSQTQLKIATDEFLLTLEESCYYNKLALDGSLASSSGGILNIPNQQYKVTVLASATPAVNLLPLYSSSIIPTSCPLTAYFYVWDDVNNVWVDKSALNAQPFTGFVQADTGATHAAGKLTIYQTSATPIAEKIYRVKIKITDLKSADPIKNAIEHEFNVDVYHACQRNTLSFNTDQANQ